MNKSIGNKKLSKIIIIEIILEKKVNNYALSHQFIPLGLDGTKSDLKEFTDGTPLKENIRKLIIQGEHEAGQCYFVHAARTFGQVTESKFFTAFLPTILLQRFEVSASFIKNFQ